MDAKTLAKTLVDARKSGASFAKYPTEVPKSLDFSYQVQDEAIKLYGDKIIGWKIGRLAPDLHDLHGTERLTGPIFECNFQNIAQSNEVKLFDGGFAAVEAEYVFEIVQDAPNDKFEYSEQDALGLIKSVYAGIEMAGSPIFDINAYGPTVVASDFGNNFGLILGAQICEITNANQLSPQECQNHKAQALINGEIVGEGGLFSMPNGPLAAIAWLAGHLAKRGHSLKKGQFISSGASTGIHQIEIGQKSQVIFESQKDFECVFNIEAKKHN
jgi:2-keto-4-pentenoate hydratase